MGKICELSCANEKGKVGPDPLNIKPGLPEYQLRLYDINSVNSRCILYT